MKLLYLKSQEIDPDKWDQCVQSSSQNIAYVLFWYLEIVCPEWEALIGVDERQEEYQWVLPLPIFKKYGHRYVRQPFFCNELGVFSREPLSEEMWEEIFAMLQKKVQYAVRYRFNVSNHLPDTVTDGLFWRMNRNYFLDLNRSYEEIYQGYSKDRKMNLKRAQKNAIKVIEGDEIDSFIKIFKEDTAWRIQGGVAEETYEMLGRLFTESHHRGVGKVYYTQDTLSGDLNSACFLMVYGDRMIYLLSCAKKYARKQNGRTMILDHIFKQYENTAYIFDFESPDPDDEPSLAYHYKSFGCEEVQYPQIGYDNMPWWKRMAKKGKQIVFNQSSS